MEDLKSAIEAIILGPSLRSSPRSGTNVPRIVYIPPSHAQLFGRDELVAHKRLLSPATSHSHPPSPHGSASPFAYAASSPAPGTPTSGATARPEESIWRALQRGYNRHLGPLFRSAVERFNTTLAAIRPEIAGYLSSPDEWNGSLNVQLWQSLCELVGAQCYQRVVGPELGSVHDYEPFSDNVYGELEPM